MHPPIIRPSKPFATDPLDETDHRRRKATIGEKEFRLYRGRNGRWCLHRPLLSYRGREIPCSLGMRLSQVALIAKWIEFEVGE